MTRGIAPDVIDDSMAAGILAGEDRGPIGRAQRRGMEGVGKQRAFMCQAVNMRGLHVRMAAGAEFVEAQVIDQDHDQVGTQCHDASIIRKKWWWSG